MATESFDSIWRGLLARAQPRRTPQGTVRDALNVVFCQGLPRSRPGGRPYTADPGLGADLAGLGFHINAESLQRILLLATTGGDVYRVLAFSHAVQLDLLAMPSTLRTRTSLTRAFFCALSGGANLTFLYDGVNTNLKYDGVRLTRMGLDAGPALVAGAVVATGGDITNGLRQYVATLDSGFHEGDPSTTATAVDFTGGTTTQQVTITGPSSVLVDDPQVSTWKLYRTVADGEDYFYVSSAGLGVDIIDTLSDEDLVQSQPLEEFVNTAPAAPFVCLVEHRGQLIGVDTLDRNLLRHSYLDPDFQVPEGWPPNWTTPVAHGDGDQITALASFHDWLIVFKRQGAYALTGTWPDMDVQPLLTVGATSKGGLGVAHQGCVMHVDNTLRFVARDGIYAIGRDQLGTQLRATCVSEAITDLFGPIDFNAGAASAYDRQHRTAMVFTEA